MPEEPVHEATSMARIFCMLLSSLCGFLQYIVLA